MRSSHAARGPDVVIHRREMQAFECTVCHRGREIPKHVLADPLEFAAMKERFARVHEACEAKRKLLLQPAGGIQ